ncbi:MAG: hypothetical protein LCH56_08840 [Proteobacteria bacterium]|nr:hypothetical protein [Pseudomonadota bacterium]
MATLSNRFPSKTRAALAVLLLIVHLGVILTGLVGTWQPTFANLTVPAMPQAFGDFRVVTAAPLSADQGLDPLVANPNDPGNRRLNYPRVWISIGRLFPGEDGNIAAGLMLACLFSGIVAWLVATQKSTSASVGLLAAALSPATWLALERGNTDLLIFGLVALGILIPWRYRTLLLGLATILKIYPFVTTVVRAIRERTLISFGILVAVTVYLIAIYRDVMLISETTEVAGFLSFGIKSVTLLFAGSTYPFTAGVNYGLFAVGTVAALVLGLKFPQRDKLSAYDEEAVLLVGTMLLFCFVTASNWDYRLIFTLLLIPYFLRPATGGERVIGWTAVAMIVLAGNYTTLMNLEDPGVLLNTAAKYLLYCILVFSVTRVIVQTEDVQFMIENWRATAK